MSPILLFGGGVGLGAHLIIRSALRDCSKDPSRLMPRQLVRRLSLSKRSERVILDVSDEVFATSLVFTLIISELLAVACLGAVNLIGVSTGKFGFLALVACPALGVTFYLGRLDKEAAAKRRTFSYALSSYLDLVSVLLAGGAGIETALVAAATTGSSWSFRLLRQSLETGRATRVPAWSAFADLGRRLGIVELERIAGSMQLAGEQGARVRTSLAAQAEALRTRQIAEIEAHAQAATERMGIPTVLLFVGFIALLGYPALNLVVGQM